MAEAKEITNNPYIPKVKKYQLLKKMLKKASAAQTEQEKFLQSLKYVKLPDEEKEARKKEHIDDEAQQEEKKGTALSDVSLSGETVDALEEIKRMAEGITGTTAGSIDLKI